MNIMVGCVHISWTCCLWLSTTP